MSVSEGQNVAEQHGGEVCPFCENPLEQGTTACQACGAYGVDKGHEVVWYRKGDSPERQRLFRIIPAVVTLLVIVVAFVVVTRVINAADRRADRLVECAEQGVSRADC